MVRLWPGNRRLLPQEADDETLVSGPRATTDLLCVPVPGTASLWALVSQSIHRTRWGPLSSFTLQDPFDCLPTLCYFPRVPSPTFVVVCTVYF